MRPRLANRDQGTYTRSCVLLSASENSIVSIPSPVYQCMNALRLYIAENYFKRNIENGLANSVKGLARKRTWDRLRVNSS